MSTWIKFKLIDRPYYTKSGALINRSLSTNTYGISDIRGGGKLWPDLSKVKVLKRYRKDDILYVLIDESVLPEESKEIEDLLTSETIEFDASPTTVSSGEFYPKEMDEETVRIAILDLFGIDITESGVTK